MTTQLSFADTGKWEPRPVTTTGWNPYYVAWARVNGRTPDEQATVGCNADFMAWITARHREHHPGVRAAVDVDVEAFTDWLMVLPVEAAP